MFEFSENKVFKDTVHGYIQVPIIFVKEIIDTPLFQRLRNIEQTGMRIVYPSARHDRFIHSLGVYHLGVKAVDSLLINFNKDTYWNIRSDDTRYIFWAKNKVLFLIACLLHDIGHAPFSHSLEKFYTSNKGNESYKNLTEIFKKAFPDDYNDFISKPQPHEAVSAAIVLTNFREPIQEILRHLHDNKYPDPPVESLSEHETKFPQINFDEIDEDLKFVARMITGLKYSNFEPEYQIRNCFISLLNGNNFDVDKLDYIIRDGAMSGIDNVQIDVERLLKSLTIIKKTNYKNYLFEEGILKNKFTNIFILDSICEQPMKDGLITIDGFFNGEVIINDITESVFNKDCELKLHSPSLSIDTSTELAYGSKAIIGTAECKPDVDNNTIRLMSCEDAKFEMKGILKEPLKFHTKESHSKTAEVIIEEICGDAKIICKNIRMSSTEFSGTITGKLSMEILDDTLVINKIESSEIAYNSFEIGFNKQALNIIQNVVVARNYLYLWIYAHHKVVYSANFLLIELFRLSIKILKPSKNINDFISFGSVEKMSDIDAIMLFKRAKLKYDRMDSGFKEKHADFAALYNEYLTRKMKKSLFKSLPEYDLLFKDFGLDKKSKLRTLLPQKAEGPVFYSVAGVERSDAKYGFWDADKNKELFQELEVQSMMWVDASYSMKNQDIRNQFIRFASDKIVNLKKLSILNKEEANMHISHYFYIYYEPKKDSTKSVDYLKSHLLKYFSDLLA